MEYSIQELSRLSGVTTRTLRWYDQIGLLKPSRVAESGYRYYGRAEVDRLQDILYYRALGVELARIKECLDDPSFDRLAALERHLAALEAKREHLEQLIQSVKDTIRAEERKEFMHLPAILIRPAVFSLPPGLPAPDIFHCCFHISAQKYGFQYHEPLLHSPA